jgi:PHD finger-like domain-containing protein 5A
MTYVSPLWTFVWQNFTLTGWLWRKLHVLYWVCCQMMVNCQLMLFAMLMPEINLLCMGLFSGGRVCYLLLLDIEMLIKIFTWAFLSSWWYSCLSIPCMDFCVLITYFFSGTKSLSQKSMTKHHPDLIMGRKQPVIAIGRLCEKCDGKCVICNYRSFQGRCVICGGVGISDAYYCKECTQQEKDRDGCPKIVNFGECQSRSILWTYEIWF